MARVAHAVLGMRLDPWQAHIADVAGELDDDGLPLYRTVVVHVPRQQGKSVLVLAELVERILRPRASVAGYLAQTGFDARNKLLDDWVPILEDGPLGPVMRVRRSAGNTAVVVGRSALRVLNTTRTAGRGQSLDLVVVDEAMAHGTRDVWAGVAATTITRPQHQMWAVSNAGTDDSLLLAELLGVGRQFVADDRRDTVACFDWHADPDDDPAELTTWARAMPAMAAGRVHPATIAARYAEDTSPLKQSFRREFLNVWASDIVDAVLPTAAWAACQDPDAAPVDPLTLAVEVAWLDAAAAVVAADPRGHVEVVDHRPGTAWLPARLAELVDRHRPVAVLGDPRSPLGAHLPAVRAAGTDVWEVDLGGLYGAAVALREAVVARRLHIRPSDVLDAAAAGARRRIVGDRWVLDRRDGGDASPLVAAALAHHHATTAATPAVY